MFTGEQTRTDKNQLESEAAGILIGAIGKAVADSEHNQALYPVVRALAARVTGDLNAFILTGREHA